LVQVRMKRIFEISVISIFYSLLCYTLTGAYLSSRK